MPEQQGDTATAKNSDGTKAGTSAGTEDAGKNGTTAAADNKAGKTEGQAPEGKISFSPEQQTYINSLIKSENSKAVEKALKKFNDEKDLSEKEKAERRAAEAEKALQTERALNKFAAAASEAKCSNPQAVFDLLRLRGDIEADAEGNVKNLNSVLTKAKTLYPEFFPAADADADGGKGSSDRKTGDSLDKQIRKAFGYR